MSSYTYTNCPFEGIELDDRNTLNPPDLDTVQQPDTPPVQEIWVGYVKHSRQFIDKLPKAASTEDQLRAFEEYYKQTFTPMERIFATWMLCKKPVVYIGELSAIDPAALEHQHFPHEVYFDTLEEHAGFTAAFSSLKVLEDHSVLLDDNNKFDVAGGHATAKRHVLCVKLAVDKRRLVWPLLMSIVIAVAAGVIAGVTKQDFGVGVELGAFVGTTIGMVWGFVMWLLR